MDNSEAPQQPQKRGPGRPVTINASVRKAITIDQATYDKLMTISPNLSEAIRIAVERLGGI